MSWITCVLGPLQRECVTRSIRGLMLYVLLIAGAVFTARGATATFEFSPSGNLSAAFATNLVALQIVASPVTQIVPPGGNAGFSVIASGSGPLSYQWLKNNQIISGATSDSLFLNEVSAIDEGEYRVRITNPVGVLTSSPAILFLDVDLDGLPDVWERTYFGSVTNQTALGDRDSDGVSNLDEFREGTVPTNAVSQLPRLNLTSVGPGTVTVSPLLLKYVPGQPVALTAVPSAGASFLGWSGDVTNTANPLNLSMDATRNITALFGIPLEVALESSNLTWRTGGAAGWLGQSRFTRDGVDASQSGPIRQDQQSWLETTIVNPQPVALDFWWALSGTSGPKGNDNLALFLNTVKVQGELNIDSGWAQKTVILPPGTNVVRWLYSKRSITPRYTDVHNGAFVDQVALRPIAAISVADIGIVEGHSGTNLAVFRLELEQPVAFAASVRYFTTNVTAFAGSDYLPASGTIQFPAGSTFQTISIPVLGDLNQEGQETFRLLLHTPTTAYLVDGDSEATIFDDEIIPVRLQILSEGCVSPNGYIDPGETVTVALTLSNPGPLPTSNLSATLLAGNGVLQPSSAQSYGAMPPDGSPLTRNFTFIANGSCGSEVNLLLALQDVSGPRGLARFTFNLGGVSTSTNTFTADPITVNLAGAGSPYPSTNVITGVTGTVSRLRVVLDGLSHPNPDELDLLLVSPRGKAILLMSDAGGTADVTGAQVIFEDGAPGSIPDAGPLVSGTFRPSQYDTNSDAFLPPAPVGPYETRLSALLSGDPNGPWLLYVHDDTALRGGSLSGGWGLVVETFDASCCTSPNQPDLALIAAPLAPVVVGHEATLELSVTNLSLFQASGVTITNVLPPGLEFVSASTTQGTWSRDGSEVVARLGVLPVGNRAALSIQVIPTSAGSFTNVASALGGDADPNYANNFVHSILTSVLPALSINDVVVSDAPTNAVFQVTLAAFTSLEVTARYGTTNVTAVAGADYASTSGLLRFPPGVTTQFVTVPILGDGISEANETFNVVISAVTNAAISDALGVGTITDDDLVPGISISDVEVVEGHSGLRNAVFTLSLSSPSGQTATVRYSTANGSAVAPGDYTARSGTVTFAIGVTNQTVSVPILGDITLEGDETFVVNLSSPVRATLNQTQAVCFIKDDELVPDGLNVISENCDPFNGVIDPGETVTVGFQLRNPGPVDMTNVTFNLVANSLLLAPSSPVTIEVIPGDNSVVEVPFTFSANGFCGSNVLATILLREGTNNRGSLTYAYRMGVVTETTHAFSNSASLQIPLVGASVPYPASNVVSGVVGTVNRIAVTLSGLTHPNPDDLDILLVGPGGQSALLMSDAGGSGDAVGLDLVFDEVAAAAIPDSAALASGSYRPADYQAGDAFPSGPPVGPYTAGFSVFRGVDPNGPWRLFIVDDAGGSGGEIVSGWTLRIHTFDASCCEETGAAEMAALRMTTITNQVFVGHDLAFVFTITNRSPITATGVTVTHVLPADTTFVSARGSQGDCLVESNRVMCILGDVPGLGSATTTVTVAPNRAGSFTNQAAVTANQLDPNTLNNSASASGLAVVPALVVADAAFTEGDDGLSIASYRLALNAFTSQRVWVRFESANGSALGGQDFTPVTGLLSIPPGSTNASIEIPMINDRLNEAVETFSLRFSSPTNATLPDNLAVITLNDNDPLPQVSLAPLETVEGDTGTNVVTLEAILSGPSSRPVSFTAASANGTAVAGTDYVQLRASTISFPAGTTRQIINLGIRGDTLIESNETFFVNLSAPGNLILSTNRILVTIVDNDLRIVDFKQVGNDIHLSFTTAAGRIYRVERAESLAFPIRWEPVAGAASVGGTGSVVEEVDAGAVGRQQRFYRILQLP